MNKRNLPLSLVSLLLVLVLIAGPALAAGEDELTDEEKENEVNNRRYIAIGALLAMSIAGIVSAFALGHTGASAMGVISEKEEHFGKAFILQVLPMTQGLYGFVIGFMLILGMSNADLTDGAVGWIAIAAGLVIALTGISAIPQGQIASAGIQSIPRNPELSTGKKVILAAMPETMAVFGFLIAILLMQEAGIL
jgi:V/A-type H+-transporting ATPase subunit K